jgi:hypothetical protein
MPADVIYFTRFLPSQDRGGGSRRLMQIWDAIKNVNGNCELVSSQRLDRLRPGALRRCQAEPAFHRARGHRFWSEQRRSSACRLGEISREWSRLDSREIRRWKLAIMDDPIYFSPLLEKLKRSRVPVIAICHNLESLVPSQAAAAPLRSLFPRELDLLAQCRLVITISREETFLLNNLGIPAMFFPYYPVEPTLGRLLQVRERRRGQEKNGIFLLGNALNPPTRQGMEKMIEFWRAGELFRAHGALVVGGFGTARYISDAGSPAFEFVGDLADDELAERLTRVRACLCFQEQGAGALTRIAEMLLANIPVLANSQAARSYYDRIGVIEFRGLPDLAAALERAAGWAGDIPLPPAADGRGLAAAIEKAVSRAI